MHLAALSDIWKKKGTIGCYLAVFSVEIALAHHFVASHYPTLHPCISACGIGYASKIYLK